MSERVGRRMGVNYDSKIHPAVTDGGGAGGGVGGGGWGISLLVRIPQQKENYVENFA